MTLSSTVDDDDPAFVCFLGCLVDDDAVTVINDDAVTVS